MSSDRNIQQPKYLTCDFTKSQKSQPFFIRPIRAPNRKTPMPKQSRIAQTQAKACTDGFPRVRSQRGNIGKNGTGLDRPAHRPRWKCSKPESPAKGPVLAAIPSGLYYPAGVPCFGNFGPLVAGLGIVRADEELRHAVRNFVREVDVSLEA